MQIEGIKHFMHATKKKKKKKSLKKCFKKKAGIF